MADPMSSLFGNDWSVIPEDLSWTSLLDTIPEGSGSFNQTNITGNTTGTEFDDTSAGSVLLSWFLLLLFCCAMRPLVPDEDHSTEGAIEHERRERMNNNPERRKRVIAASLVVKRVVSSDDDILLLGDASGSTSSDDSISLNSFEDETTPSCVICLDRFRKDDLVAFSKALDCKHVFHQECIEGWLADPKHDDCPSCRCQIIDDDGADEETLVPDDLSSSSVAFAIIDGLIAPIRSCSRRKSSTRSTFAAKDENCSHHDVPELRRSVSFGRAYERKPSGLSVALRRVSKSISWNLDNTFASQHDINEKSSCIESATALTRAMSEGTAVDLGQRDSILDPFLDIELGECPNSRRPTVKTQK